MVLVLITFVCNYLYRQLDLISDAMRLKATGTNYQLHQLPPFLVPLSIVPNLVPITTTPVMQLVTHSKQDVKLNKCIPHNQHQNKHQFL